MSTYTYQRDEDGVNGTFDIYTPKHELLVSLPFWDAEQAVEEEAKLIVAALNAYPHSEPKWMTTKQLEEHTQDCYLEYMREEAAERSYDHQASRRAWQAYSEALRELEGRRQPQCNPARNKPAVPYEGLRDLPPFSGPIGVRVG